MNDEFHEFNIDDSTFNVESHGLNDQLATMNDESHELNDDFDTLSDQNKKSISKKVNDKIILTNSKVPLRGI